MANTREKKNMMSNDEDSKQDIVDVAEFANELNKRLVNAIFKLDPAALEREDGETPLVELYQISQKWLKLKFKKSQKTWLIERDTFAERAGKALVKKLADAEGLREAVSASATKLLNSDDPESKIQIEVDLQTSPSDAGQLSEEDAAKLCKVIWDNLAMTGAWKLAIEDKITDQNISRDIYHSLVRPYKQDGSQCRVDEFVTVAEPVRSSWYTNGEYIPGSSVQIWYRAVDPIAWFGEQLTEKPKTLDSYDSRETALEPPSRELVKEADDLAELDAF